MPWVLRNPGRRQPGSATAGIGTSALLLVPTLPGGIVSTTNCSLVPPIDAIDVEQEEDKEHDEEDKEQDEAMAVESDCGRQR